MRFKYFLIFLSIVLNSSDLFACLSASQNRIFPLGKTSKGLCVVETHLYRTEYREKNERPIEMKPVWVGLSYFKIYDKNFNVIHSELLDTLKLFLQEDYVTVVSKTFGKGMNKARTQKDFIEAEPAYISICDYRQSCNKASLLVDTLKNMVSLELGKEMIEVAVIFDTTSIAANFLNYYRNFYSFDEMAKSMYGSLFINSIREFSIGNGKLSVVHIGSGLIHELAKGGTYPPGTEHEAEFSFNDINKSVFEEGVLHHGHGFDFWVWKE